MSVSIDGAGSLIGVDQGLNIVGLTTLTGGIILDDSISHIGDTDTKIRFPAADTFTVETAGSERLRIDSVGWLGFNQTTKEHAGQVAAFKNTNNTSSWLSVNVNNNTGIGGVVFGDSDSWNPAYIQYDHTGNYMQFISNGAERLRIESNGYVKTTSEFWVGGAAPVLRWRNSSNEYATARISSNDLYFEVANAERLRIKSDGKISIGGDNNSYLYRSALNTWTFSFNSVDTFRLYEDTAWILSNNITPNPNNTGSEIQGAMLRFGNNIWLQERYPNGAYSDRQDLVLNTDTGYGLGQSDKVRITAGGSIELNQHHSSATTNSGRSSPSLKFKGHGWNTSSGSEEVGTQLQSVHTYWQGSYSNAFGQTYPDFKILIKNSDSATYAEKFAFSGNGVMRLQSGGGINFHNYGSGTGVTSNILDDYEEGTWTPTVSGTTGGSFTAGASNYGSYVKVGRLVTASATIHWTGASYSGLPYIGGLPFASNSTANYRSGGIMPGQNNAFHATGSFTDIKTGIDWGLTYSYVVQVNETATSGVTYNHSPTLSGGTGWIYGFAITYQTD